MSYLASLAMIVAAGAGAGAPMATRTIVVPHASGPAQVEYRGDLAIEHRQVGSVAPGGRASTLRCMWTANLRVDRIATHASGSIASRSFVHDDVARGHHPGWCRGNAATGRDVAARALHVDRHIGAAIDADRPVLHADLERLGSQRGDG